MGRRRIGWRWWGRGGLLNAKLDDCGRHRWGRTMRSLAFAVAITVAGASPVIAQTLDQQERCARQARRAFQEIDAKDRAELKAFGNTRILGDHQSHYNTKLGKCLILVETTNSVLSQSSTSAYLMDANERRQYAIYVWISHPTKKYWEVPPRACELTPRLSEKKSCASREEFDTFVASYLED